MPKRTSKLKLDTVQNASGVIHTYSYGSGAEAGLVNKTIEVPGGNKVTGQHGYRANADQPISETTPSDYDLLVIPGGQSPERLRLLDAQLRTSAKNL